MKRRKWHALEEIPDPSPNSLGLLIDAEEQASAEARAAPIKRKAGAFKAECSELHGDEQALCAAFLMDERVPGRTWGRMQSSEVASLFGRTATWVRVSKLLARRKHPCSGGPASCGLDQPACAHARGRKIFYRTVLKALNRPWP